VRHEKTPSIEASEILLALEFAIGAARMGALVLMSGAVVTLLIALIKSTGSGSGDTLSAFLGLDGLAVV
jgi:hypothetical protein